VRVKTIALAPEMEAGEPCEIGVCPETKKWWKLELVKLSTSARD